MKRPRPSQAPIPVPAPKCIVFWWKSSVQRSVQPGNGASERRQRGVRVEGDQLRLARGSSNFMKHQEPIGGGMKLPRLPQAATTTSTPKCIVF